MYLADVDSREVVASILRKAGIRPNKQLGQNFLVDRSVVAAIIACVNQLNPQEILEIGSGLGTVTAELSRIARHVVGVEIDSRLANLAKGRLDGLKNVEIECKNILRFDLLRRFGNSKIVVVGNIPYRITAPILRYLVNNRHSVSEAVLLTQEEVVQKIAKSPGKDGSGLGVFVQAYADVEIINYVSKRCFYPVPQVDSVLWKLSFLGEPRFSSSPESFFGVVQTIYGKRRKMIRVALRDVLNAEQITLVLEKAEIDPCIRGESLSFVALDQLALELGKILEYSPS